MFDWFVPIPFRPRRGLAASFVHLLSEVWGKLFNLAVIQDESSELTQLCDTIIHTGRRRGRRGRSRGRRRGRRRGRGMGGRGGKGGREGKEGERWKEEKERDGKKRMKERVGERRGDYKRTEPTCLVPTHVHTHSLTPLHSTLTLPQSFPHASSSLIPSHHHIPA